MPLNWPRLQACVERVESFRPGIRESLRPGAFHGWPKHGPGAAEAVEHMRSGLQALPAADRFRYLVGWPDQGAM